MILSLPQQFYPVTVVRVLDFTHCNYLINVPSHVEIYYAIPHFVLGALLLILAVTQALKGSIEIHKATKQWRPNQYTMSFANEGTLYFFSVRSSFVFIPFPIIFRLVPLSRMFATTNHSNTFIASFVQERALQHHGCDRK